VSNIVGTILLAIFEQLGLYTNVSQDKELKMLFAVNRAMYRGGEGA
jgi:hypothetical protein